MSPIPQFVQKLCLHPLILPSILFIIFLYKWINQKPSRTRKLPPSPTKLPILGNLHQLGRFPHRSLHSLSKRYGEVMLIYLGNTPAFVITSARAACEIMKTHDTIFSNRTVSSITKRIIYGGKDLVFSPYGEYWRQIRSICVLQVLSNKKVQSFRNVREEEVSLVVEMIRKSEQKAVNMSEIFVMYSTNVLCRTAYGKKYAGEVGTNFKQLLKDFVEVMAEVKIGDFIPWLGWVDKLTGLEKRVEKVAKEFDQFLQHVVQEHLDRKKPPVFVKDMFAAGSDTTYTLLEWTMTELMRHPRVMKEMKAVIKEVLRLHPPLPLLLFRELGTTRGISSREVLELNSRLQRLGFSSDSLWSWQKRLPRDTLCFIQC